MTKVEVSPGGAAVAHPDCRVAAPARAEPLPQSGRVRPEAGGAPLKVLHAAEVIRGGTATYLDTLAPWQFAALGDANVRFLVPAQYLQDIPGIRHRCVRSFPYPGRSVAGLLAYARALNIVAKEDRPEIIHAHGTFAGLYVRLWALTQWLRRRPRIVYCAHGWSFQRRVSTGKRWAYVVAERLQARLCDALIAISRSEFDAALAVHLPRRKLLLIRNGLADSDAAPARPERRDHLALLFVGRFDEQKGLDVLLDCLRRLRRRDYCLYVAGAPVVPGDDLSARLEPLPPNVLLMGWQSRETLPTLYAKVDAVVVPSRWEGFGYVALEAMRAGRAVIAARTGGLPELVRHGQTGLLFDLDQPQQLQEILEQTDRAALAEMGCQGRARFVAEFQAERMHRELLAAYHAVAGKRHRVSHNVAEAT